MAGKKKKTTTIVEEIPPGETTELEAGETTEFDLDLQRAEDAETVDQMLRDNGISNVVYRFYDNDGGYCYSSPELDYDRARRETKGGKHCKLGVFIAGKIIRMVPFPLSPLDPAVTPTLLPQPSTDAAFMKELLLKLIENRASSVPVPTVTELIQGISALDGLRGKQESAMDLFQKGIEFAQNASGQTDWKTDALRTVRDLAPQIMGGIDRMRGGGMPVSIDGQPQAELPPDAVIKAGIQYLKKKAIAGIDPELIIEWVANNGEEYEALLRVVLNSQFADFVKFDPEIGTEPFVSWFKPLFDGLRSAFKQSDSVDVDPRGDMGNVRDIGSHGDPGKAGGPKPKS